MTSSQIKACGACDGWIEFVADHCPECGAYQGLLELPEGSPTPGKPPASGVPGEAWGHATTVVLLLAFVLFAIAVRGG